MAVWCLCRAFEVLETLPPAFAGELTDRLGIYRPELDRWDQISRKMRVCFHEGVISQFEGYERLVELDWDRYRDTYGDIGRLDRILEAEGDSPDRYKLTKQADVIMLFYLLSAEELAELLERLGYPYDRDLIQRNFDYYVRRTAHGSSLSRVVHAWVAARRDRHASWELFARGLHGDVDEVRGGTTAEGIHLGAMAGHHRRHPALLHRSGDAPKRALFQPARPRGPGLGGLRGRRAGLLGLRHPLPRPPVAPRVHPQSSPGSRRPRRRGTHHHRHQRHNQHAHTRRERRGQDRLEEIAPRSHPSSFPERDASPPIVGGSDFVPLEDAVDMLELDPNAQLAGGSLAPLI